jgi:hypothetical protein
MAFFFTFCLDHPIHVALSVIILENTSSLFKLILVGTLSITFS